MNSTQFSHFRLAAYSDSGLLRYFIFLFLMVLYISIICCNLLLIVLICLNRSLHEPMYVFLCSLFVNELYGSAGLFPFLLPQILADVHTVSAPLCFLQIFCLHCYGNVELMTLTIMSYDRYLSVCYPLQYCTLMTPSRVAALVAAAWLYGVVVCVVMICISASLQLCGNIIHKVYCDNYPVVELACSDATAADIYGLVSIFRALVCPLILIPFTYINILKVCFSGSKHARQKAFSTCTPQLLSILNFSCGAGFEIIQSRFDMTSVHNILRITLSLYFVTCQPLFNPVLYGLKLSKIRTLCKRGMFSTNRNRAD